MKYHARKIYPNNIFTESVIDYANSQIVQGSKWTHFLAKSCSKKAKVWTTFACAMQSSTSIELLLEIS